VSEPTVSLLADCAVLEAGALKLKGKSGRTKLFAVVGDATLSQSQAFLELKAIHGRLMDALRAKSPTSRRIATAAKNKAVAVSAGLQPFYARISKRAEHFADHAAQKTSERTL
jgi:adenylate cyclase